MSPPSKLMNRDFLLLWQGQTISRIGTHISMIAILFWLKHATESPILIGAMTMLSGLAAVLLGPIGGAFADRHSRRSIIIICDLISGLAVISLSLLMFFSAAKGWILAWVFAVSIILSIVNSFSIPATTASIADLAPKEKVAGANSMLQASIQISTMLGQGIGGMLFRTLGAPLVILIDGVTYLFSGFSKCFMTIPQALTEKNGSWRESAREFKREIWEGVGYVRANTGMTQLLLIATFLNFFMAPILGMFPFYVEDHLKLHPDEFGYLLTAYGVGSLGGCLLAGAVTVPGQARAGLIIACMMLMSALCGLLGVAKMPAAAAACMAGIGAASGFLSIKVSTILQITTPSEIRGRVFGLLATISACLLPVGTGLGGAAASLVGKNIPLIYLFCGACMALVTLAGSALSEFRRYLAFEPNEARETATFDQGGKEITNAD